MGPTWIDNGGGFWIIGGSWIVFAAAFTFAGIRLGERYDAPHDGCLVGILCVILTVLGGCIGLLAPGGAGLPASVAGAGLLPSLALLGWARKTRPRR